MNGGYFYLVKTRKLSNNFFNVNCISKVIMGCKIEKNYEEQLITICRDKTIKLSKMVLDNKEYKLIEQELF